MSVWQVIDSGLQSAEQNMAVDRQLLQKLRSDSEPTLHFYDWNKDSATYGYFLDPKQYLKIEELDIAKRPTGGGILFHLWDMTYSIVIPANYFSSNTLENYKFIHTRIVAAIANWTGLTISLLEKNSDSLLKNFCMANPVQYDIMWKGQKIAGGAQRRTRQGFLHQGSISLAMPNWDYLSKFFHQNFMETFQLHSTSILEGPQTVANLRNARSELKNFIIETFQGN